LNKPGAATDEKIWRWTLQARCQFYRGLCFTPVSKICDAIPKLAVPKLSLENEFDAVEYVRDTVQMTAITYTAARENLASTMDRVCNDRDPVIITRNRDQAVVMLSLDDYESLQETAYLLRSPANARRLFDAIEAAENGHLIEKTLSDLSE